MIDHRLDLNPPAPIVFVHSGRSWYLPYALQQARLADPGAQVFLIGDPSSYAGIEVRNPGLYEDDATRRFREVFRPFSSDRWEFVLIWFLRWFYLSNFMRKEGFKEVFHFDSDVLSYSTGNEVKSSLLRDGDDCGLSIVEQLPGSYDWTACGHASYWKADILAEFCEFCIRSFREKHFIDRYSEKLRWHQSSGINGGISDMVTLYFFWEENHNRIANFSIIRNGAVIDHNIALPGNYGESEYEMEGGIKKIRMSSGKPFLFERESGERARVHSIHFQGARKYQMPAYYTGPPFAGKRWGEMVRAMKSAPRTLRSWKTGR